MNQIAGLSNPAKTMSSLEISELVESRHDKVKQSIERLAGRAVIELPPMGKVENKQSLSPNNKADAYIFSGEQGKRDSLIVVAQLCPEFTARIIDRWQELEARQSHSPSLPDFSNPAEAARAWAEQYERNVLAQAETQRLQVVCNTLAAQFQPGETAAQFCRQLNGVNTQAVQNWLADRGYLIRSSHGFKVASRYRDDLFAEKHSSTREGRETCKAVLTLRGAKWLYKQYLAARLPMKATWDRQFTHCLFEGEAA